MRRFLAGFAAALVLVVVPVALAAGGDQTVKGDLTVNGSATIQGDTSTRSVQAFGPTISNFEQANVSFLTSNRVAIRNGGFGYGWLDANGTEKTRLIAGDYTDPATFPGPTSSLLITRGPARLWFKTDNGWECIAGCSP